VASKRPRRRLAIERWRYRSRIRPRIPSSMSGSKQARPRVKLGSNVSHLSLWKCVRGIRGIKRHDVFEIKVVFQREWTKQSLSLDTTVYLKTVVHFDSCLEVRYDGSEPSFGTHQRYASRYSSLFMAPLPSSFQPKAVICVSSRFCHCSGYSLWRGSSTTMSDG
jgi:hypothetical protein